MRGGWHGYRLGLAVLLHNRWRCLAAALGIAMAVAVIFLEAGFFFGVVDSQARIAKLIQGDLVVQHAARTHLNKWQMLPRFRLGQIEALAGVGQVAPIYKRTMGLENPENGRIKRIVVYAWRPDDHPLALAEPETVARLLKLDRTVLFDRRSRRLFGEFRAGQEVRLDRRAYRIGALVDIGPGIVADGAVVMGEGQLFRVDPTEQPVMAVVRLAPGAVLDDVRRQILRLAPGEISVLTPTELGRREMAFTASAAPIGVIFGIGMLAGLVIGMVTCYQVLFNEIADQVRQFAMLRAIGFSAGFLGRIILAQALALSLLGFAVALAFVGAIYAYLAEETALVMQMTWSRTTGALLLTVLMCLAAALLALRRAAFRDPAELI